MLLLPGFLPSHSPEGKHEGIEEMPGRYGRLLGDSVESELHPLSLQEVSHHRDEAGTAEGEEEE